MPSTKKWSEIEARQAARDPEWAARRDEGARQLREEAERAARALAQIRHARKQTQADIAKRLGISHAQVTELENNADLYLSILSGHLEAVGGRLDLLAVFGDERSEMWLDTLFPSSVSPFTPDPDP